MKIISIILIFFASQAYAQTVKGSFDCTATGVAVVASEEGKFKTYPSVKGGVKANENLTIEYSVSNNSILLSLKRDQVEKNIVINAFLSSDEIDIKTEKVKNGGFILTDSRYSHSVSFLPDYIRINAFREFFISRYYKNDWHGIYSNVSNGDSFTETVTLNCRHTNDKMDAAFKIFTGNKAQK
jgi:hypothetical protein